MRSICLSAVLLLTVCLSAKAQMGPEFDARNYDRILIPVWAQNPIRGGGGSLWVSEFWVRNESDSAAWVTQAAPICIACDPNQLFKVQARSTRVFRESEFLNSPAGGLGIFLHVEKGRLQDFHFWLRVFNLTRIRQSLGTEVPVVREDDAFSTRIALIGIPLEAKFRLALRIYAINRESERRARVKIYAEESGTVLVDRIANLGSDGIASELNPYAQSFDVLDLVGAFPQLISENTQRLRVEITSVSSDLRFWAFVAATNNETQEVTTFTPQ